MINIASVKYFSEKCWLRCVTTWSSWYPYKELWRLPLYFINVKVLTWKVMLILALLLLCGWGWVYGFTYMSLVVSQYKILVCPTATFVLKNIGMFLWLLCVMATLVNPPTVMLSILQIFFFVALCNYVFAWCCDTNGSVYDTKHTIQYTSPRATGTVYVSHL